LGTLPAYARGIPGVSIANEGNKVEITIADISDPLSAMVIAKQTPRPLKFHIYPPIRPCSKFAATRFLSRSSSYTSHRSLTHQSTKLLKAGTNASNTFTGVSGPAMTKSYPVSMSGKPSPALLSLLGTLRLLVLSWATSRRRSSPYGLRNCNRLGGDYEGHLPHYHRR